MARFLSTLDINGAYHSIPVAESSRDYLTFVCHFGLYRWKRLPYGYKNSGPNFCRTMFDTFLGVLYEILAIYADDIFVFGGNTSRMHIRCISLCIQRLAKKGFRVSLKKCVFFAKELEWLGVTAIVGGTKPCTRNVDKIRAVKIKSVSDIRSFLGLSNYYRRFIENYAKIVAPLLPYLGKNAKVARDVPKDVRESVEHIKRIVSSYPILRNPDFKRQFVLETDGSLEGFGAILKQNYDGVEFIVAFASSHIVKSQKKYMSDMLELVAAVWAMKHFRHYLRHKFILKTDNMILKWL